MKPRQEGRWDSGDLHQFWRRSGVIANSWGS